MIPISAIDPLFENLTAPPTPWTPADRICDHDRASRLLRHIQSTVDLVFDSAYYRDFISEVNEKNFQGVLADALGSESKFQMIIYGIGSIENYRCSPFQLALALLLRRALPISTIQVFDPVLSATECAVLEDLDCHIIREDERGMREVMAPTIFFMPHCELTLYENVLRSNWRPECLNRMIILGNRFSWYKGLAEAANSDGYSASVAASSQYLREAIKCYGFEVSAVLKERERDFETAFTMLSWHFFYAAEDDDMNFIPTEYNEMLLLSWLDHCKTMNNLEEINKLCLKKMLATLISLIYVSLFVFINLFL